MIQNFTRKILLFGSIPLIALVCYFIFIVILLTYSMGSSWGLGWSFVIIVIAVFQFLIPCLIVWGMLIFFARKSDKNSKEYDDETKAWHDRLDAEDKVREASSKSKENDL